MTAFQLEKLFLTSVVINYFAHLLGNYLVDI